MSDRQLHAISLDPRATRVELTGRPLRLVVISAGVSDPSSTRMLADRAAQRTIELLRAAGREAAIDVIDLAPHAVDIARAMVSRFPSADLQQQIDRLASADAVIAATPIYTAGVSGLFKSFLDLLDGDLLLATPVLLAATAGSSRHALVVDAQMRPLFAYLRALSAPTSLFAAPEDWGSPELGKRIDRAAVELAALVQSTVAEMITDQGWDGYQHQFGGDATRSERSASDIDFDSPLMRLATGGCA